jgi:hypothetical protein
MRHLDFTCARRWLGSALLVGVFCAVGTPLMGQTLADVARAEDARRKAIKKPAKVYTNESLRPAPASEGVPAGTAPVSVPADQATQPPSPTLPRADQKPVAAPAEAEPPKNEAYWRKRITDARATRDRNVVYLDSLESRINGLWAEFTARDDPAQRAAIAQARQRALEERDRLRKEQGDLEKQIKAIEEEARRAGVPPGWLR